MNGNLALLTGQIAGLRMTLNREDPGSLLDLDVLTDEKGNYTNQIVVTRPSGQYLVTVEENT